VGQLAEAGEAIRLERDYNQIEKVKASAGRSRSE
jgi:hypothetical protein